MIHHLESKHLTAELHFDNDGNKNRNLPDLLVNSDVEMVDADEIEASIARLVVPSDLLSGVPSRYIAPWRDVADTEKRATWRFDTWLENRNCIPNCRRMLERGGEQANKPSIHQGSEELRSVVYDLTTLWLLYLTTSLQIVAPFLNPFLIQDKSRLISGRHPCG